MRIFKLPYLSFFIFLLISFKVFSFLLTPLGISGGDYISDPVFANNFFVIWDSQTNLGASSLIVFHYYPFSYLISLFGILFHLSTPMLERIFWWFPFVIVAYISSVIISKKLVPLSYSLLFSPVIFIMNTYALMMLSGGQISGVGLAYALTPSIIVCFINLIEEEKHKIILAFIAGFILAFQVILDLRISYITVLSIGIYFLLYIWRSFSLNIIIKSIFFVFIVPGVVVFLFNFFWIAPALLNNIDPLKQLGPAYSTTAAVRFLSFGKFEDTLALLHPNWPENIFGKIYFIKPEFLLLPIFAYMSVLFTKKYLQNQNELKEKRYILYFSLLGLIGSFFAKGSNEPFGNIYLWMFHNIPGFIMFRDPTKWYTLIALSYSVLVPFSIWKIYILITFLKIRMKKLKYVHAEKLFIMATIFYLLFLIRVTLFGQLNGTFKPHVMPIEYMQLKKLLTSQNGFFRTFWVPAINRSAFYSNNHPAISAYDFFKLSDLMILKRELYKKDSVILLQEAGVRYVIVPYDSEKEIFLTDRRYDSVKYNTIVNSLRKLSWLKEVNGFGKLKIFEISHPKDHFWSQSTMHINYSFINPAKYRVNVQNVKKGDLLVFSESFDSRWQVKMSNIIITSRLYDGFLNSFTLSRTGNYSFEVVYKPQNWVNNSIWISIISLIAFLSSFGLFARNYNRNRKGSQNMVQSKA